MAVVDFLIAGVQKGGTTALHHFLSRHPQLFLPASKELHYFDNEKINWRKPDYRRYDKNFQSAAPDQIRGEATPIYTYWTPAMERIARYNPSIKLIITLRNPVDRAFSHWRMQAGRRQETLEFSRAIREGRRRVVEDAGSVGGCHRAYSYVERGFYAGQVKRVLSFFARTNVLFLTNEAMRADLHGVLNQIAGFLGVDRLAALDGYDVRPVETPSGVAVAMSAEDRAYLWSLYEDDVRETGHLTGLDLSSWRSEAMGVRQ